MLSRLRGESGFTLVELLVAITIGSVVMLATFSMLDSSVILTGKTHARVDATQRGRLAMETITTQLRSQACPNATTSAIVGAGGTAPASDQYSVDIWVFTKTGAFVPERHVIAWNTNTNSIVESDYNQAGTLLRQRTILTKVRPPQTPNNAPVFSYFAYPPGGGTTPTSGPLQVPLSSANAASVALVKVAFTAQPDVTSSAAKTPPPTESQTFTDQVFVRTADPNAAAGTQGPACA
jgi:prepilin-type N-terminal cleavage/methylation domain-containing protein